MDDRGAHRSYTAIANRRMVVVWDSNWAKPLQPGGFVEVNHREDDAHLIERRTRSLRGESNLEQRASAAADSLFQRHRRCNSSTQFSTTIICVADGVVAALVSRTVKNCLPSALTS
jgi:hypothetical protein